MTFIEDLGALRQKQRVGLGLEDGTTVETRINQSIYAPDEHVRLELVPDSSDGFQRYQVLVHVEGRSELLLVCEASTVTMGPGWISARSRTLRRRKPTEH